MKVSQITADTALEFIRCEPCCESRREVEYILSAAKAYVCDYTGLTLSECDEHEDITIAVLCLCSDMYDNRQTTTTQASPNRTVETILNMYRRNFL